MFGLGFQEMVVIAVLVLMFFPADDLPELMRTAGRWYARLRRASDELRRAFNTEVARAESEYRLEELRARREAAARARQEAGEEAAAPADPRLRPGVPLDQRDEDRGGLPEDAAPRALPPDAAPRPAPTTPAAAPEAAPSPPQDAGAEPGT